MSASRNAILTFNSCDQPGSIMPGFSWRARFLLAALSCFSVGLMMKAQREFRFFDLHEVKRSMCDYRPPKENFIYPINASDYSFPLPLPMQVMEEFIAQHSKRALLNDPHPEQRKYALAFYQCPLNAGNNMHRFFNGLLWSILTNRTMVVRYWSKRVCKKYGLQTYSKAMCRASNNQCDCDLILNRAPWMPMFNDFEQIALSSDPGIDPEEAYIVPYHATMGRTKDNPRFPIPDNFEEDYGVDLVSKYPHRLVMFPLCYLKFRQLRNKTLQDTLLTTDWARERAERLFSLGEDFLYGMLHSYTFHFASDVRSAIPASLEQDNQAYFTIGLHSRHRFEALDGCDISRETQCIEQILNRKNSSSSIQVRIMSDRPCTVKMLSEWLKKRNHTVMMAKHEQETPDMLREHGPYAGIGYFKDLAVVSTAQNALVAMTRSSSDLLKELMVFKQAIEYWKRGQVLRGDMRRVLMHCVLPYQPDPSENGHE